MEDPWASGSAWTSDSKALPAASSAATSPQPALPSTPPANLDVSDPWGAPTPAAVHSEDADRGIDWTAQAEAHDEKESEIVETPGWGRSGWGQEAALAPEEPLAGPSRSPRKPQDSPEWGLSGAQMDMPDHTSSSPLGETLTEPEVNARAASPSVSLEPFAEPLEAQPSPPADIAVDLPTTTLPQSPSLGEDFGGFTSGFGDDPWGTKKEDTGWAQRSAQASSDARHSRQPSMEDDGQSDDGWGGVRERIDGPDTPVQKTGDDDDWEEAQRRLRVAEERAPRETIVSLQDNWRDLVSSLAGENKLEALDGAEGDEYDNRLRRQTEQVLETLRSLSTLPPDVNTYPPVLSSFETYERYQYALKRPNTLPETSLLNMPMGRRSRRHESALDNLDSWTSRSRLGEPEAPQPESSSQAGEAKSKWSFWRKPTAEKPLVTSGGGILEVKSTSTSPAPVPMPTSVSVPIEPRSSIGSSTSKPSRPASPAPSMLSTAEVKTTISNPTLSPAPASATPAGGPSAVSRFFGRLSRRQTSQSIPHADNGDMEFSADDFSFLDQVPSLSAPDQEKAVGDLLSMEGGRSEEIASLESMLRSKPTPLPAPLAPPPMASRTPSSSRVPSASVPRRDMDLLSGLDFGDEAASGSNPTSDTTKAQTSDWDDFLANPAPRSDVPAAGPSRPSSNLPSLPPTIMPSRSPQPFLPPAAPTMPAKASTFSQPDGHTDFDDFTDFAASASVPTSQAKAVSDDFDDFGDFGDFATSAPQPVQQNLPPPQPPSNYPQTPPVAPGHAKRTSLDHSLTLNLINDASAVKGKRWPAPPSPLAPSLDPPPKAPNASNANASFPFISPPPGSARTTKMSGLGDLMNDSDFDVSPSGSVSNGAGSTVPPARMHSPPIAPSVAMQPMRSSSPLVPPKINDISRPTSAASATHSSHQKGGTQSQTGLSAQDLSFFDSL